MKHQTTVQDLLFDVEQGPIEAVVGSNGSTRRISIPGKKALIHQRTGNVLGVVSRDYRVVTNQEAVNLARDVCEKAFPGLSSVEWEAKRAAAPRTLSYAFIDLMHKTHVLNYWDSEIKKDDPFTPFLRVTNSFNGVWPDTGGREGGVTPGAGCYGVGKAAVIYYSGLMSSDLNALIAEATRYARFTMNKSGCLAPVMMASTEQGLILFTPDSLSDTGAKDDFANKVRLITASYGANAVVLILESWITKAKPGENFDAETPPSESYDREEVVVVIGQSPQGNITRLLPIHRLGNGKFWNLGDAEEMAADSFSGRFAELLPPKPSDEKTRQMGRALLQAMGVKVIPLKQS